MTTITNSINDRIPVMSTNTARFAATAPPTARRIGLVVALVIALCLLLAGQSSTARADVAYGIASANFDLSTAQAGAHPDVRMRFTIATDTAGTPPASTRTVITDLPAGLIGNATNLATCDLADVIRTTNSGTPANYTACPRSSAVGYADVTIRYGYVPFGFTLRQRIYRLPSDPGEPAAFGTSIVSVPIRMTASVRSDGDYGLRITGEKLPEPVMLSAFDATFWGVPADHQGGGSDATTFDGNTMLPNPANPEQRFGGKLAGVPRTPFLTNPGVCTNTPLLAQLSVQSWAAPNTIVGPFDAPGPTITGCDLLPFNPTIAATPDSTAAGSPSGLQVDLAVPQTNDADLLSSANLRDATVTLPRGMALSPSFASGLDACSDAQLALHSMAVETCPLSSKIGTVRIDTPLLDTPMHGSLYVGTQQSNDPASGRMYRLFLTANGSGVRIKLAGAVKVDPASGQVTAVFADNPQLPFSNLHLAFKGGARAPLTTPATCGTFTTRAVLTSWSGKTVVTGAPMTIDQGCDRAAKFEPAAATGTVNPTAGALSPLVLRFGRPDGQQELGAINGSLPPGLLGYLKSVPLCSPAQGAAGTCPAASRVGRVEIQAGAGSSPLGLPVAGQPEDSVYLTEPYRKGDVAGLSIVVRAIAGPFNLGTVVTKAYLKLRPEDQGINLQSDQLPRIVGGVPVQIRQVTVTVDRQGFMVNPTNCSAMAVYGNVFSQSWTKVALANRFQVGDCASLALSPTITASGGGKGNTKRYEHPSLKVSITQAAGQSNLNKANVVLPKELNIDLKAPALKASCPRAVYAQDKCSPVATVGTVKAVTPLLREPLTGPAFLLQKKGELPDIVMRLRNNRMSLDLIGVLDFLKDGRLITRVKGIPDAALSSFVLNIKGGKNGSLLNRSDLCAHKRLTKATFKGQNGKLSRKSPVTRISGCKSKASTSRAASRRAARSASARASAARGAHAAEVSQRAAGGRS